MASTGKAGRTAAVQTLAPLKRQFAQWRAARRQGEKIPAQLWDAATRAMAEHGAYRVSRECGLDYVTLKRRALAARVSTRQRAPGFVELAAPQRVPMHPAQPEPASVVEMVNGRGATMRLQLHGAALAGLPALCRAFWSA